MEVLIVNQSKPKRAIKWAKWEKWATEIIAINQNGSENNTLGQTNCAIVKSFGSIKRRNKLNQTGEVGEGGRADRKLRQIGWFGCELDRDRERVFLLKLFPATLLVSLLPLSAT